MLSDQDKGLIITVITRIKEVLLKFVNKTPLPGLINIIYNPKAKDPFNSTLAEAQATAPEAKSNWVRLGLDKLTTFGMPIWSMFLLIITAIILLVGGEAIINVITMIIRFVSQFYLIGVLGLILWMIWKKFKG